MPDVIVGIETTDGNISAQEAIQIVSQLLPETDSDGFSIERYENRFAPPAGRSGLPNLGEKTSALGNAEIANDLDDLLQLEHSYLVQLERLACLDEVLKKQHVDNDDMSQDIKAREKSYEGLYRATLAVIRKMSSGIERAVMSLHAFLREASGISGNQGGRYESDQIGVLNAPADVFNEAAFGTGRRFGALDDLGLIFENSYALWVSDGEFSNFNEFQKAAMKAKRHDALLIVNWKMDRFFPKRLDLRQFRSSTRQELTKADLVHANGLKSDSGEAGHVVVCAVPWRVRSGDCDVGEYLNATIPLSFILAGKLFWVANESDNRSAADCVASMDTDFDLIVDYIDKLIVDDDAAYKCPANLSYEGALLELDAAQVVAVATNTNGIQMTDKGVYAIRLTGMRTIKKRTDDVGEDDKHLISNVLVNAAMQRILKVTVKKYEGKDKAQAKQWCLEIKKTLEPLAGDGPKAMFRKNSLKVYPVDKHGVVVDPDSAPDDVDGIRVEAEPKTPAERINIRFALKRKASSSQP